MSVRSLAQRLARRVRPSAGVVAPPDFAAADLYELTWGIPREYGGMTSVMLQRAHAFHEELGQAVTILTLDPTVELGAVTARLRTSGALDDSVTVRNIWHELCTSDRAALTRWFGDAELPQQAIPGQPRHGAEEQIERNRTIFRVDGDIAQIRYRRSDGSECAVDDRTAQGRRLWIIDLDGSALAVFDRMREFYFAWFDCVIAGRRAVIINESKTVAEFFHRYRRPRVLICQVLHNAHLASAADSVFGPYTPSRRGLIAHSEQFDIMAFLTQQQKDDFEAAFGRSPRNVVLPNARTPSSAGREADRPRASGAGILLGSLETRKRIEDAIDAVIVASARAKEPVTLDIYGAGPEESALRARVTEAGAETFVRLRGYTEDARAKLRDSSFLLFTSRAEGMGLVLVEAMAEGCVPLSYDVRYGPSDIITDGVDGFLVNPGDTAELAQAISSFVMADAQVQDQMRAAAVRRAADFDEAKVARAWKTAIDQAWARRKGKGKQLKPVVVGHVTRSCAEGSEVVEFRLRAPEALPESGYVLDVVADDELMGGRFPVACSASGERLDCSATVPWSVLPVPRHGEYRLFIRESGARLGLRTRLSTDGEDT